MSSDEKVLDFPRVEGTSEENAKRVMIEATRLASLAPGEWRLWIDRSAERLRIPRATLEDVIAAIIKDSEKKARDAKTEARRHELAVRREQERKQREQKREQERTDKRAEHKRKEREKAFESLISLPSEQQKTRLGELAKRLDEDVAAVRDHFTAFVGMQSWTASTDSWNVELWPDPVETQALLQKISAKVRKYIVLRPEAVIATALWTMTAWAHEGATHSPILAAISVEPDSGKSTLLGVLRFLVPKPFVSVEPTGPSVYRTVDREHPTLIIDEADDLFYRKSDLRAIVNAGWSRGTRIPRQGRWYDPFCPKILGILGKTKLPRTIASRSIILKMSRREGGLFAGLRTYLPLRRTTLTQQLFGSAPQISATLPQRHRQFCASSSLTEGRARWTLRLLEYEVVEHHLLHPLQELARLPEDIAQQF